MISWTIFLKESFVESNFMQKQANVERLLDMAKVAGLSQEAIHRSLDIGKVLPDRAAWRAFLDKLLIFLGTTFGLSGLVFFFAYNWANLGKWLKLGLIPVAIIALIALATWKKVDSLIGKCALLGASVLVGIFLAIFGQIYQTGADPYELFIGWTLLIIGWVLIARFPALWIFWLLLANASLILYYQQTQNWYRSYNELQILLFLMNLLALIAWEIGASFFDWLKARWAITLIALYTFSIVTTHLVVYIFERRDQPPTIVWLYIIFVLAIFGFYRYMKHELSMLAINCLSLIVVITAAIGKELVHHLEDCLMMAIIVLVLATISVAWLRGVAKSWNK